MLRLRYTSHSVSGTAEQSELKILFSQETDLVTKTNWIVCGNKMPTRCNRCFLLQILLLAQHVLGTIMPIIRSSRVLYSWLPPVVFGAVKMENVVL
jgi:hypothetical protein